LGSLGTARVTIFNSHQIKEKEKWKSENWERRIGRGRVVKEKGRSWGKGKELSGADEIESDAEHHHRGHISFIYI
jgi:hypothetical protein